MEERQIIENLRKLKSIKAELLFKESLREKILSQKVSFPFLSLLRFLAPALGLILVLSFFTIFNTRKVSQVLISTPSEEEVIRKNLKKAQQNIEEILELAKSLSKEEIKPRLDTYTKEVKALADQVVKVKDLNLVQEIALKSQVLKKKEEKLERSLAVQIKAADDLEARSERMYYRDLAYQLLKDIEEKATLEDTLRIQELISQERYQEAIIRLLELSSP